MKEHKQKLCEGIFILKPDVTDEQIESVKRLLIRELSLYSMNKKLSDLIIFQNLGKKVLAYEITHGDEKYKEGYYISLELGYFTEEGIQQVDKSIKAHRDVLKHIIITLKEDDAMFKKGELKPFEHKTLTKIQKYQVELLSHAGNTEFTTTIANSEDLDLNKIITTRNPNVINVNEKNLTVNAEDILYGFVELTDEAGEHKGGDK